MNTDAQNGKQMRISPEERLLISKTFKDNDALLKLLRKLFLPEIEADAPIGQIIDLWMTIDVANMTPDMALINIKARNMLITHVEQQLMALKLISEQVELTPEEISVKKGKDSSK